MKKVIRVKNAEFHIESEDDLVSVIHMLACDGYNVEDIAKITGVSEKKVLQYLQDCW